MKVLSSLLTVLFLCFLASCGDDNGSTASKNKKETVESMMTLEAKLSFACPKLLEGYYQCPKELDSKETEVIELKINTNTEGEQIYVLEETSSKESSSVDKLVNRAIFGKDGGFIINGAIQDRSIEAFGEKLTIKYVASCNSILVVHTVIDNSALKAKYRLLSDDKLEIEVFELEEGVITEEKGICKRTTKPIPVTPGASTSEEPANQPYNGTEEPGGGFWAWLLGY